MILTLSKRCNINLTKISAVKIFKILINKVIIENIVFYFDCTLYKKRKKN